MSWLALTGAIAGEVTATAALKLASGGSPRWYVLVLAGYALAFGLLTVALGTGMPLGVAYGVWAAAGVALTAILSAVLFGERLTRTMVFGIGLIVVGVLLLELGRA